MIDIEKLRLFPILPISINTKHRQSGVVTLRLICLQIGSHPKLLDWFNFKSQNNIQGYLSYSQEVLINFVKESRKKLYCIDLNMPFDTTACFRHYFSGVNILPADNIASSCALTQANEKLFYEYACLLVRNCCQFEPVSQAGNPLMLSSADFTKNIKLIGYNNNVICWLPVSTLNKLHLEQSAVTQSVGSGNSILSAGKLESRMILVEGRGRHIPVEIGYSFRVDLSMGIATLFMSSLRSDRVIQRNQVFDTRTFAWDTSSENIISGICGVK